VRELAIRSDPETMERIFRILRDARTTVEDRLRKHGVIR
jgi:hypothetical protein